MLGYVTIGVQDIAKGKAFWGSVLEPLGAKPIMDMGRMVLFGNGPANPMLGVCTPHDDKDQHPGNGNMLAFKAGSRENVDKMYANAIAQGGTDEGAPGERGPTFYGAYFRDPDGNKAVFYHAG